MACAGALLAGCGEKKADAPPPSSLHCGGVVLVSLRELLLFQ
jgi:hypothetical protein